MTKKVIFTAKGFGLHPFMNSAIIELANDQKIKATSVVTTAPFWREDILRLKKLENFSIGIEFNLTMGKSLLGHKALPLLTKTNGDFRFNIYELIHKIELSTPVDLIKEIKNEMEAQLKIARDFFKVEFFNGIHHIHTLPSINLILRNITNETGHLKSSTLNDRPFQYSFFKTLGFRNFLKILFIKYINFTSVEYFKSTNEIRGIYLKKGFTELELTRALKKLEENKTYEFIFHPSKNIELSKPIMNEKVDAWLEDSSHFQELITLRELKLPDDIELINFNDL